MAGHKRDVILYELNEVPWSIVDYYVQRRPQSNLAALLDAGQSLTTHHSDAPELQGLQPWRTWPSFHNSTVRAQFVRPRPGPRHLSRRADLGCGRACRIERWPVRTPAKLARPPVPQRWLLRTRHVQPGQQDLSRVVERFQAFNLAMTGQNDFSSDAALNPTVAVGYRCRSRSTGSEPQVGGHPCRPPCPRGPRRALQTAARLNAGAAELRPLLAAAP